MFQFCLAHNKRFEEADEIESDICWLRNNTFISLRKTRCIFILRLLTIFLFFRVGVIRKNENLLAPIWRLLWLGVWMAVRGLLWFVHFLLVEVIFCNKNLTVRLQHRVIRLLWRWSFVLVIQTCDFNIWCKIVWDSLFITWRNRLTVKAIY